MNRITANPLTSAGKTGPAGAKQTDKERKPPSLNLRTLQEANLNLPAVLKQIPGIKIQATWNTTTRTPSVEYFIGQNLLSASNIAALSSLGPTLQKAGKTIVRKQEEDEVYAQIIAYGGEDPTVAPEFKIKAEKAEDSVRRIEHMIESLKIIPDIPEHNGLKMQIMNWLKHQHRQVKRLFTIELTKLAKKQPFDKEEEAKDLDIADWTLHTVVKPEKLDDYGTR